MPVMDGLEATRRIRNGQVVQPSYALETSKLGRLPLAEQTGYACHSWIIACRCAAKVRGEHAFAARKTVEKYWLELKPQ